jgi:hypothetical protein
MDLRCDHLYCDRDRERFWPYLGGENGRYVSESASSESNLRAPSGCEHTLCGPPVSHFVSILLLAMALTLTLCFGVAAWRVSAGKDVDITARAPHREYGWIAKPAN